MGSNKPRPIDYHALHRRYIAGESGMAIAADIGIKWSGLYRAWKRLGLATRTASEAALARDQTIYRKTIVTAQDARRGRTDPWARKVARALTREARMIGTSAGEDRIALMFDDIGAVYVRQKAIGPYNVDFAFPDFGVVLEVSGGGHNPRVRRNAADRRRFIESQGWWVVTTSTKSLQPQELHDLIRWMRRKIEGLRPRPMVL